MDIKNTPAFSAVKARMEYLEESFKAQASNLARVDIPGESAVQIEPMDFKKMVLNGSKAKITKTNDRHLSGAKNNSANKYKVIKDRSTPTSESGNNVDQQKVAGEMTNIAMEHKKLALIYKAGISQIRKVLGK